MASAAQSSASLPEPSPTVDAMSRVGSSAGGIAVTIGTRFLELFSKNLYSSANKAFEELISNSWDADARSVYIHIPEDLDEPTASIWVLDDGDSMDFRGLEALWAVAQSNKRELTNPARPQIGKFGIGKLATYVIADELTYICRASDGVIRIVTMDYRRIATDSASQLHRDALTLEVREISEDNLRTIIGLLPDSDNLQTLIDQHIPSPNPAEWEDEFGGQDAALPSPTGSWTLVVLSNLKEEGRQLQPGRLDWILRSSLPLGPSISIVLNGTRVRSSKLSVPVAHEWRLGADFPLTDFELPTEETIAITSTRDLEGIELAGFPGRLTGTVRLFKDKISGGKSEETLGASNGFFVNILGRVINVGNSDFGLENLSHGAWASFRATIRADGLDSILNVERETIRDSNELIVFRSFLREIFNLARKQYKADEEASWPLPGDVLVGAWQQIPLKPLISIVSDHLTSGSELPSIFRPTSRDASPKLLDEWRAVADATPRQIITDISLVDLDPGDELVQFELETRKVVLNSNHPFYREHSQDPDRVQLLRQIALAEFLYQAKAVDLGVSISTLDELGSYRDNTLRLMAQLSRKSGPQIVDLLLKSSSHAKGFEVIVGDALEYLGFVVERMGETGNPEGLAKAPLSRGENDSARSFSFTYDAKSTSKQPNKVSAKDVGPGRLARHRQKHGADFALVVAPDFALGDALVQECTSSKVTPMRAATLGKLVMLKAAVGSLDLPEFRGLFSAYDPNDVDSWVEGRASAVKPQPFTIGIFLDTIGQLGFSGPDVVDASVVASKIRERGAEYQYVTRTLVRNLVAGLQVIIPGLIGHNQYEIFISATPSEIRKAIMEQLAGLPMDYRFGIDAALGTTGK